MVWDVFILQSLGEFGGVSVRAVLSGIEAAFHEAVAFGSDHPFYLIGLGILAWFSWSYFFRSS
ncbi:MAG TPA: hypothetical protein VM737_05155 [Gemmatimonadota bacterium]|nr:hypothetical protein [Gemmatimonadota bacterium]